MVRTCLVHEHGRLDIIRNLIRCGKEGEHEKNVLKASLVWVSLIVSCCKEKTKSCQVEPVEPLKD